MVDFPYLPTNKIHAAIRAQVLATTGGNGGSPDLGKLRAEFIRRDDDLQAQIDELRKLLGDFHDDPVEPDDDGPLEPDRDDTKDDADAGVIAFYAKAFGPNGGLSTKSPEAGWLRRVIGEGGDIHDLADWALDKGTLDERAEAFVFHMKDARPAGSLAQEMTDDELSQLFLVAEDVSEKFEDTRDGDDTGEDRA